MFKCWHWHWHCFVVRFMSEPTYPVVTFNHQPYQKNVSDWFMTSQHSKNTSEEYRLNYCAKAQLITQINRFIAEFGDSKRIADACRFEMAEENWYSFIYLHKYMYERICGRVQFLELLNFEILSYTFDLFRKKLYIVI